MIAFSTTLLTDQEEFTARFIELPADVAEALGAKGRMRVKGTLNGVPFETALAKYRGTGYVFPMKKELREAVGVEVGDEVRVEIEQNYEDRPTLPEDIAAALADHPAASIAWQLLPPSHQRKHLNHIKEAKTVETRAKRVQKMLELLT